MELLIVLALLLTLGKKGNKSPQELFAPFSQLVGGQNADKILESDLFKDVRIMGMKPAELLKALEELRTLLSALPAPAPAKNGSEAASSFGAGMGRADTGAQSAAGTPADAGPAESGTPSFLAPVSGIADENIERMLGKYFS